MIIPNWPVPTWVRALTTTRVEKNQGLRDGADPVDVSLNRLRLEQHLNLRYTPVWLDQTHGINLIEATYAHQIPGPLAGLPADGVWTQQPHLPCAVLTADCLPLLFCDEKGTVVSAIHAGWRGILGGIIENTLQTLQPVAQGALMAWLGPAISAACFEVGPEVRAQFVAKEPALAYAFTVVGREGKWLGDLYELARIQLRLGGITRIYGGQYCTYTQGDQFYSFRREKCTGRMASLIWLNI